MINIVSRIVEHFEFGSCMFDPKGLVDRYQKLEKWNGKWLNFWTRTIVHDHSRENEDEKKPDEEKPSEGSDNGKENSDSGNVKGIS